MEFLDLLETIPQDAASERRLFSGEGRRARNIRSTPRYQADLLEAVRLVAAVAGGSRRAALTFEESMSTSDFPLLFGDILDRQVVAAYREYPSSINQIAKISTVRDFRAAKRFAVDGAEGQLLPVAELEEYPEASLVEAVDTLTVAKFGRRVPLSWEMFVNDDLDTFRSIPGRLGRGARRSEQKFVTMLYADANGPHASLYDAGKKNQVITANGAATNNPALSITGLQDAMKVLANQKDTEGEPIYIESVTLVVPPALEIVARNILNAVAIRMVNAGGATGQELEVANWMKDRVTLVVDPYLPVVATTNGNTSWFLFANPSSDRAALEFAHLRGHEEPEIWVKRPDAIRAGGGEVGPDQGDFDTDGINYRVRAVYGGARLTNTNGPKMTVASNGTGA